MADLKKKPALSLVIASKGAVDEEPDEADDDGEYEATRDELAEVLGVADDKREAFGDALRAFVMSCK